MRYAVKGKVRTISLHLMKINVPKKTVFLIVRNWDHELEFLTKTKKN
jgi:hypothetical protein